MKRKEELDYDFAKTLTFAFLTVTIAAYVAKLYIVSYVVPVAFIFASIMLIMAYCKYSKILK